MNDITVHIRVNQELKDKLDKLSAKKDLSVSQLIRKLIKSAK